MVGAMNFQFSITEDFRNKRISIWRSLILFFRLSRVDFSIHRRQNKWYDSYEQFTFSAGLSATKQRKIDFSFAGFSRAIQRLNCESKKENRIVKWPNRQNRFSRNHRVTETPTPLRGLPQNQGSENQFFLQRFRWGGSAGAAVVSAAASSAFSLSFS